MIPISLTKIASIINGKLYGKDVIIDDISINTKKIISSNSLFIALKGKKFDAHIFLQEAIKNGCIAIITEKKISFFISYIVVKNTSVALGQIAHWVRKKTNPQVLAITGSCGKTSVKEMTASILQENTKIISTINNLNNHIGVPITLLRLTTEHKYCVIELGSNHIGEIQYTTQIAKPNIVLINNIYYAHLKGFKSLLGISKEKSEILSNLEKNDTVIINLDSHHLSQWKKKIRTKNIIYFSIKKKILVIFLLLTLNFMIIKHLSYYTHHLEQLISYYHF